MGAPLESRGGQPRDLRPHMSAAWPKLRDCLVVTRGDSARTEDAHPTMLRNIPTPDGMEQAALRLYFTALEHVSGIISEMSEIDSETLSLQDDGSITRSRDDSAITEFVTLAQPDLQLAYTLIQQSQEISLKAKICSVSPFLLLLGSDVRTWPKSDADFAQFRTIDASDLAKVVNAICQHNISSGFAQLYDFVRGGRNMIYHLGIYNNQLDPKSLLNILVMQYVELHQGRVWLRDMLNFQCETRHNIFYTKNYNEMTVALLEAGFVFDYLTNKQFLQLFGFSKRTRRYLCHACHDE
jgi:hypothetical protein